MKKQIQRREYYPPTDEAVDQFVRDASLRIAAKCDDSRYLDSDVIWGFSAFLKLAAKIKAKQLNEANGSAFDSPEKPDYPI